MRIKVLREATDDLRMRLAILTALVCGVTAGLYTVLGLDPHPFVNTMLSFGPALAVVLWLERDVQRTGVGAVHDVGMFLMMGWWVAIPWYAIKTRGRSGWWLMVRLFGLIAASYSGALIAVVLYSVARLLADR